MTLEELRAKAKELGLKGYSKMRKADLEAYVHSKEQNKNKDKKHVRFSKKTNIKYYTKI